MSMWTHDDVVRDLRVDAATDRRSYGPGAAITLTVRVTNSGAVGYSLGRPYTGRSVRVLLLERGGRGEIAVRISTLFGEVLALAPGETKQASVMLRRADVDPRIEVLHYDLPPNVRLFQVFVPLSADALTTTEMVGVNLPGVDVRDSWVSTRSGLAACADWLRGLFGVP